VSREIERTRRARLCVVTAAEIEFKAVAGLLARRSSSSEQGMRVCRGRLANNQITLLKSEIGAAGFAERLTTHLAATRYDALLVIGLAGGLDPLLKTGDAVVYDLCLRARAAAGRRDSREKRDAREENVSLACDPTLSKLLVEALRAAGRSCAHGVGLTIGRVVAEAEGKLTLGKQYGAAAVDMETYEVLAVCARLGLPASAMRVVLDEASCEIPDFSRALGADGSLKVWPLMQVLVARPVVSVHFCYRLRQAMRALRQAAGVSLGVGPMVKPSREGGVGRQSQSPPTVDKSPLAR